MQQRLSSAKRHAPLRTVHENGLLLNLLHQGFGRILRTRYLHRQSRTHLGTDSAQGTTRPIRHDPLRRECQCLLRTSLDACPATDAFLFRIEFLLPAGDSFRIMAPYARQGASFHKDRNPDTRPVVDGISFYIENKHLFSIAKTFPVPSA